MELFFVILSVLIRLAPYLFITLYLFSDKLKYSLRKSIFMGTFYVLAIAIITFIFLYTRLATNLGLFLYAMIWMLLGYLAYKTLLNTKNSNILFLLFLIKGYTDSIGLFSKTLSCYIISKSNINISEEYAYISLFALLTIITLPILTSFIKRLLIPLIDANENVPFWRYLFIIPLSFCVVFSLTTHTLFTDALSTKNEKLFVYQNIWITVWSIGTFLSYFFMLKMLIETRNNMHLKEELRVSSIQISSQEEEYRLLTEHIESTRRSRHDLHHNILSIKGFVDNNDCEGLRKYLNSYLDTLKPDTSPPVCDSYALDSIIKHYINIAKQNNICITLSLNIPADIPILENDICIIFANLLENAIEACIRQNTNKRYIKINSAITGKNILLISIENSYEGNIKYNNGIFSSSKRNAEGIGIGSVKSIACKYNGITKFEFKNNVFKSNILLNPDK